jgi:hypothetical protein
MLNEAQPPFLLDSLIRGRWWYSPQMKHRAEIDQRFEIINDMIQKARQTTGDDNQGYHALIEVVQALADEVRELAKGPGSAVRF